MRVVSFLVSTIITIALIILLDNKWGSIPPLGKFLSPQNGFWQNAEPVDHDFSKNLSFKDLKGKVNVYLDERLVPHVFAQHDEDVYFVQGYLHAKFRLWQMEFQTFAAAGRVSEILGNNDQFLRYDREQRRLGMVYAAENAVSMMDADASSKNFFDAYTAGINSYINTLEETDLPVEYKLLDYKPENWSNLKTALFLKMMSKDLAGHARDIEYTNMQTVFSDEEMQILFPQVVDSLVPIIPKGTAFASPGVVPVKPASADSLYFKNDTTYNVQEISKPDQSNGSNSWVVSGKKTASGAPILANDPHLGLTLPAIWYEMQLTTPTMNVYGATFPGAPSVIIGFNDSIAFGFTNAQRDVRDYYKIKFKDASKKEYWFNNKWEASKIKIEEIKIRGASTVFDTVAYTVFGPVIYDEGFIADSINRSALAVRWVAHDPSNEGAMWFKLNRAKNYNDFAEAIKMFSVPGQNMTFASKDGDISIWQQAKFPAYWDRQGLYIMPGEDSSYMWQGFIPQQENPHVLNPEQGFIQSANQRPVDSTYPYFISGNYINARGVTIHNRLSAMQNITPKDMMALQNDYYSSFAADVLPVLYKYLEASKLNETEKKYLDEVRKWDLLTTPDSRATTIYQNWMDSLMVSIWYDELKDLKKNAIWPDEQATMEMIIRDSSIKYLDNINTTEKETIHDQVTLAFKIAVAALQEEEKKNDLLWWKHKNPSIYHLLRTAVVPFARTGLKVGGWGNTINAIKTTHGPSWRMIVHLTTPTEAFGVYPGGQSGNPGSRFYDSFIDTWAEGKYFSLWLMKEAEAKDKRIKWTISFSTS